MFKITNNNISITRGETATYDAVFKHSDGTPFILDKRLVSGDKDIYGLFSVKLSMYDETPVFSVPMKLNDLATFDTSKEIISIGDETLNTSDVPTGEPLFVDTDDLKYVNGTTTQLITPNTGFLIMPGRSTSSYANFLIKRKYSTYYYWMYFKNGDGFYSPRLTESPITWVKNTAFTNALPGFLDTTQGGPYFQVWYGGYTYISGYFKINNVRTFKILRLGDEFSINPIVDMTSQFTGVDTLNYFKNGDFWRVGDITYFYNRDDSKTYKFNEDSKTFTEDTDLNVNLDPFYMWTDSNGDLYYTYNTTAYKWDATNSEWDSITTNASVATRWVVNIFDSTYYAESSTRSKLLTTTTEGIEWVATDNPINCSGLVFTLNNNVYTFNAGEGFKIALPNYYRDDRMYKRTISGVPYYYKYIGDTQTVTEDDFEEYEFRLVFPFPYNIMKTMQPKLYKYEIALVGGTPTATIANQTAITTQLPLTVDFKQYLVEYKDFKVEGSLSE